MRPLPTINQVMAMARTAEVTKVASAPSSEYVSEIARGLHEVAEIVKAASDTSVTYDEVLSFGRGLFGRQP